MRKSMLIWLVPGILIGLLVITKVLHYAPDTPVPNIAVSWNGARAMDDIKTQIAFGPRAMDAPGHEAVINYIKNELAKTAATVGDQKWTYTRSDDKTYQMTNIVARFDPSNPHRVIIGTHYDSLARAYRDLSNPNGYMPGANNSASGVALLLETARALDNPRKMPVGIDMVFFDGEEGPRSLGGGDPEWAALGSPYFARHIDEIYPGGKPQQAIIFDMACYKNIKLRPELFSLSFARQNVKNFWHVGAKLAPSLFTSDPTASPIGDDQVALGKAGISSFLVIGFEYEPWLNTTQDTIDQCSPQVMEGIGKSLMTYLYMQ